MLSSWKDEAVKVDGKWLVEWYSEYDAELSNTR